MPEILWERTERLGEHPLCTRAGVLAPAEELGAERGAGLGPHDRNRALCPLSLVVPGEALLLLPVAFDLGWVDVEGGTQRPQPVAFVLGEHVEERACELAHRPLEAHELASREALGEAARRRRGRGLRDGPQFGTGGVGPAGVDVAHDVATGELGLGEAEHDVARLVGMSHPSSWRGERADRRVDLRGDAGHAIELGDGDEARRRGEVGVVAEKLDWALAGA